MRDHVQASLRADGVPTARSTIRARCICSRPIANITTAPRLPVSEDLAQRILALPIHPDLSEADMAHVCDSMLAALC